MRQSAAAAVKMGAFLHIFPFLTIFNRQVAKALLRKKEGALEILKQRCKWEQMLPSFFPPFKSLHKASDILNHEKACFQDS